jgi:PAS domain S-box-containing protein
MKFENPDPIQKPLTDEAEAYIDDPCLKAKEKADDIKSLNIILKEKNEQLQYILDSAAEAIYVIDINGNCTFCNKSCLRILGYEDNDKDKNELLGKNIHRMIHHSRIDGSILAMEECQVFKSINDGETVHVDNEVFWRSDGTFFYAEYFSHPYRKDMNGKITGAIVTFTDITERKKAEKNIAYLSYHDTLTGLYNRR